MLEEPSHVSSGNGPENLEHPRNDLQEDGEEKKKEPTDKETSHPRSAFAFFGRKRKEKRDEPQ